MADEPKKSGCSRPYPPPPFDPFPSYQSPFPRSAADAENPFIQFRRYADSQISSLLQSFLGVPNPFSSDAHSRWAAIDEEVMRQRQQLEEGWRKQWEQDKEEQRMATEQSKTQEMSKWGMVKADAASRCPALQGHPTELDLYEAGHSQRAPEQKESTAPPQHGGWLSSMGWDGKQGQHSKASTDGAARTTRYTVRKSKDLDPVSDSDHALAWILTNPYSPVYLCNASQPLLYVVDVIDQPGHPFRIVQPFFAERVPNVTREKLARRLPWADAFEDLVRLQQKGAMVERNYSTWRTPNTWIHDLVSRGSLGPAWAFDGEHRLCRTHHSAPKPETLHDIMIHVAKELEDNPLMKSITNPASPTIAVTGGIEEPVQKVMDAFLSGEPRPTTKGTVKDRQTPPAAVQDVSGNHLDSSAPEQQTASTHWSSSSSSTSSWSHETEDPHTVVSTLTTTETRTLPDGSIETKRVLKQRFADGTESRNESVERQNAQAPLATTATWPSSWGAEQPPPHEDKQTQTPPMPVPAPEQVKNREQPRKSGGWFWI